jgi:hypothetical protein
MIARIRAAKVATVTIAVLAFGSAAAWAAAGDNAPDTTDTELEETTTSSSDVDSTTDPTVDDSTTSSSLVDETTTTSFDDSTTTTVDTAPPTECHHGHNVSEVARNAPRGHGNQHGKAVSEAAHQKCPTAEDGDDADDDEAEESAESEHAKRGRGHEKGRGKGHEKHGD